MAAQRTAWHPPFAALLQEKAPPGFEVQVEVPLSMEPQRSDLLVLRKQEHPLVDQAGVLRGLWSLLGFDTLVEFKSLSRPLGPADLMRLLGYGAQYNVMNRKRLSTREQQTLVLIVPSVTPTLRNEVHYLGGKLQELGKGYWQITGTLFAIFVAIIDTVAEAECDDLLALFGHSRIRSRESDLWWQQHVGSLMQNTEFQKLEGYDEVVKKLVESLPAVLASLPREDQVLALPDPILRGLSEDFLQSLPSSVQDIIRQRRNKK